MPCAKNDIFLSHTSLGFVGRVGKGKHAHICVQYANFFASQIICYIILKAIIMIIAVAKREEVCIYENDLIGVLNGIPYKQNTSALSHTHMQASSSILPYAENFFHNFVIILANKLGAT